MVKPDQQQIRGIKHAGRNQHRHSPAVLLDAALRRSMSVSILLHILNELKSEPEQAVSVALVRDMIT